jgi:drug/metabolite transporter (DMT)-like permease
MTGILNTMTPVFTLLVGYLVFKKRVAWFQVAGVLIGLIGAIGLISLRGLGDSKNMAYSGLIMLATFSYGFSVNTISNKLQGVPPLAISAFSLIIVGIPCGIIALTSGTTDVFFNHPEGASAFGFIATLAVMGTALGNLLFFRFTQKVGALAASSITYLIPVVAIGWGVYDNEPFTWMHAAWALVILTGIYLVNKPK